MKQDRESQIYKNVATFLNMKYPMVMYHFDLSGVNNASIYSRVLYSQLNGRAWPDLFIPEPRGIYKGLFMEIKAEGAPTAILKNGKVTKNLHVREQWETLVKLGNRGYLALMVSGYADAQEAVDTYLKMSTP